MGRCTVIANDIHNFVRLVHSFFQRNTFLNNISVAMSGTLIAQLVSFLLMPVVSRLFTPSDFGVFGSYNSAIGVLSAAATLQYAQAIVLPKQKQEAINLFAVSCLSLALLTSFCVLAVAIFPIMLQSLMNAPNRGFLFCLPIALLGIGLNETLQAWCIRVEAFKYTSASQVVRSLSAVWIWTLSGMASAGAAGLVIGSIVADMLASLTLVWVLRRDLTENSSFVHWRRIRQIAYKFQDFPKFAAPQHIMNALSQGLPVLLLGYYYGIGVAGSYAFSIKILNAPINLLLVPLRQVFYQKASHNYNQGFDIYPIFSKLTIILMAVAMIPSVVFFIWSPQIFSWMFGKEWLDAGVYSSWLITWIFISFFNVPSVICARILRKQQNLFYFECIVLVLRSAVLVVGGYYWPILTTIITFSIVGVVLNISLVIWVWGLLLRTSRCQKRDVFKSIA